MSETTPRGASAAPETATPAPTPTAVPEAVPVAPCRGRSRTRLRRLARTKFGLALVATVAVFVVYALFLLVLTRVAAPRLLSTLTATTEKVAIRIDNPHQAAFRVTHAEMVADGLASQTCVAALVRPVQHATVVVTRIGTGDVTVEVMPPNEQDEAVSATLERGGKAGASPIEPIKGFVRFTLGGTAKGDDGKACPGEAAVARLPIYGTLALADEQQAPTRPVPTVPSLLHGGSLEVSARALVMMGLMRPTTYPVGTISIPVGSRFEARRQADGEAAFWWGFVGWKDDQAALSVAAATEASAFSIYRPGVGEPVEVEVGVLAQVFNDPNLTRIQVLLGVFLLVLNLAISIFGLAPWGHAAVPDDETDDGGTTEGRT